MSKGKEPRHYVLHCEPGKYEIQAGEVTFWTQRRYDRRWHDDAVKEASREGADACRREIIFAVCLAESYLFEWVATVVQREYPGARKAVEQLLDRERDQEVEEGAQDSLKGRNAPTAPGPRWASRQGVEAPSELPQRACARESEPGLFARHGSERPRAPRADVPGPGRT